MCTESPTRAISQKGAKDKGCSGLGHRPRPRPLDHRTFLYELEAACFYGCSPGGARRSRSLGGTQKQRSESAPSWRQGWPVPGCGAWWPGFRFQPSLSSLAGFLGTAHRCTTVPGCTRTREPRDHDQSPSRKPNGLSSPTPTPGAPPARLLEALRGPPPAPSLARSALHV